MPIYAAQGAVEADVKRDLDYSRFSLNKSLSALAHGYAKLWNSVSRVDLRVFSMWLWERLLAGFYTCPLPLISLFLLVNYQSVLLKGSRESEKNVSAVSAITTQTPSAQWEETASARED